MKILLLILFVLLLSQSAFMQNNKSNKKVIKDGNYYYLFEEYESALESYLEALATDSNNANLNYKTGLCYLCLPDKKDNIQSIKYLEKATLSVTKKYNYDSHNEKNSPIDVWYYLANAYRLEMKFDEAYKCYQKYIDIAPKKQKQIIEFVKREQVDCKNAKEITKYKKQINIKQLGLNVNSTENIQSCPVLSSDGSTLVFCMGQNNLFPPDFNLANNNEHYNLDEIYYSLKTNGKWSKPENIMIDLKAKELTLPVSISDDGTTLYLVRDDNDNGNIYVSKRVDGKWQQMKRMNHKINTSRWETHADICNKGQTLYFTSEKPGGFGGLDIYKTSIGKKGEWTKPENLGPTINTRFDEETPYFDDTKKVLFFSSQGHYSMGGFDIFCSMLTDTGFAEPLNIGFPINSVGNDLVYIVKPDTSIAYSALNSFDMHDSLGNNNDLYAIENPTNNNKVEFTIKGLLTAKNGNINENIISKLSVIDSLSATNIKQIEYNLSGNECRYKLSDGEHRIIYNIPGYKNHSEIFMFPKIYGYNELTVNIKFEPTDELLVTINTNDTTISVKNVRDSITNNITTEKYFVRNILFEFDKDNAPTYFSNIDSLASYLKENTSTKIKLSGFTDILGDKNYNLELSKRRALFVSNRLTMLGVNKSQIELNYKGINNPISINDSKQSRKYNRRVEIEVLYDKNQSLEVKQIIVPEIYKIK